MPKLCACGVLMTWIAGPKAGSFQCTHCDSGRKHAEQICYRCTRLFPKPAKS